MSYRYSCRTIACGAALFFFTSCGGTQGAHPAQQDSYYGTKTPYQPAQDSASYEIPPTGYYPVHTQLAARHGSRGLSSPKYDVSMYAIWEQAERDKALTPLGQELGPDIMKIIRANALLGYGRDGVTSPGYGNLSSLGVEEHQQLARRMARRLTNLFTGLGAQGPQDKRKVMFVSSGADRSTDSGLNFIDTLLSEMPLLKPLIDKTPAVNGYPSNKPQQQPIGTNRFLLYFFAPEPERDLVSDPTDPYFTTYRAGLDYEAYLESPRYLNRIAAIQNNPDYISASRAALERLFTKDFLDKVEARTYQFANTGNFTFKSDDGQFSTTVTGDGKAPVEGIAGAATMLYELYNIAPGLKAEAGANFTKYLPPELASELSFKQEAEKFYMSGPGFAEANGITHRMARLLVKDFFDEVDAIAHGDMRHAAMLRFGHAETLLPLAAELGIPGMSEPLPETQRYSHENSAWRGALAAPMAVNLQWDTYMNEDGTVLVRMLYNEREVHFKEACKQARIAPDSYFYLFSELKACYATSLPGATGRPS